MLAVPVRLRLLLLLCLIAPAAAWAQPIEEKARACSVCHGEQGIPVERTIPIIWGQVGGYMYLQMQAYQRGTRSDATMSAIVRDMDRFEMIALSEHFAQKFWPRLRQPLPSEETAWRGKQLDEAGGCTACHEEGTYRPRIAGQFYEYLLKTLKDYRAAKRTKWPKNEFLGPLHDSDLDALARYIAAL